MYALSNKGRPGVDDGDDDRPPAPPSRNASTMSAQSTKSSGSSGGVAAAIRAAKKPVSRASQGKYGEQEYEDSYAKEGVPLNSPLAERNSGKADAAMSKPGAIPAGAKVQGTLSMDSDDSRSASKKPATTPGAVAVAGIAAGRSSIASNSTSPTPTSYQDSFAVRSSPPAAQPAALQTDAPEQDGPIEATMVEDDEADIEAQVQSRMQDQAQDIAQMVHQELVKNMAVPVDVQPSVGETSSLTADEDSGSKKKRICLIAIGLLAIIAAVGAGVGVALAKKGGGNEPAPPEKCSFCHNGFVPTNFDDDTVLGEGNRTCPEFLERQASLESTDPLCTYGQAIAWASCDCPTLPPPPANPSCVLCEDGGVPTGVNCKDLDNFLAIVGDKLASCDDLKRVTFQELKCTCGDDPALAFKSLLEPISGDALENTDSPQFQSLDWIVNRDEAALSAQTSDVEMIRARYAAAAVFFALGGTEWSKRFNFLSEEDICAWNEDGLGGFKFGIICDSNDNVEMFRLPENNLVGSIPPEIGYFSNLKNLDMANNSLVDSLPGSLVNLTRLEYLNLTENALTGTLPEFLFTHQQLVHLRLDDNAFSGTLSSSLGTSPKLVVFWARNNRLSGSIPSSVGRSSVLATINLHGNNLSGVLPEFTAGSNIFGLYVGENKLVGTVPTSIGNMRLLETFAAHENSFNGPIPSEIGQCTNLLDLFLLNNTFMTGTLPTELGTPRLMRYLYLHNNRFEGGIPSELGNLRLLQELILRYNRFNGTIPTELRGCASLGYMDFAGNYLRGNLGAALDSFPRILRNFDVSENQLTGTIPTSIGEFSSLVFFDVQSNKLVGTIPTEVGSLPLLEDLWLAYNGFNGTVPSILASLPKLTTLRVQGNEFTGDLNAFCAGTFESLVGNVCSEPETLDCACCTHCCRLDTYECPPL